MAGFMPQQPPVDWDKADFREKRQFLEGIHRCLRFVGSATVNPGGILTTAVATATITVEGARAGMTVELGPPEAIEADLIWCGAVTANDTVTVRIYNPTGSTITPASATWYCRVSP